MPTETPENTDEVPETACWICGRIPEQDEIMFSLEFGKPNGNTLDLLTEEHQYFCEEHLEPIDKLMDIMRNNHGKIDHIDILPVFKKGDNK